MNDEDRFNLMEELANDNKSSPILRNYVFLRKNVQNRLNIARDKWQTWINSKDGKKFYKLQDKRNELQGEVESARDRLREVERALLTMPLPIIVEQPVRVKSTGNKKRKYVHIQGRSAH